MEGVLVVGVCCDGVKFFVVDFVFDIDGKYCDVVFFGFVGFGCC